MSTRTDTLCPYTTLFRSIDAIGVYGKSRDLVVVGKGNSELEDILKAQTAAQGRTLEEESTPESGFYFRSDHFNFATAGVPALYTESGEDLVEGGTEERRVGKEGVRQGRTRGAPYQK